MAADDRAQRLFALSFALMAELVEGAPVPALVAQTFPGGGQYDCLSLFAPDRSEQLALNRHGSTHVHATGARLDVWERLLAGEPPAQVAEPILRAVRWAGGANPRNAPAAAFCREVAFSLDAFRRRGTALRCLNLPEAGGSALGFPAAERARADHARSCVWQPDEILWRVERAEDADGEPIALLSSIGEVFVRGEEAGRPICELRAVLERGLACPSHA